MVDLWIEIYNLIASDDATSTANPGKAQRARKAKAQRLRFKTQIFMRAWIAWNGQSAVLYYLHALRYHIPDQIELLDVNFVKKLCK